MSKRNVFLAAVVGAVVGYVVKQQVDNYQKITPEKALENAKEMFKKSGPISGSWIYMKPEKVEKNGLLYDAFRGGITRNVDGNDVQYEFYVDMETGGVISADQAE